MIPFFQERERDEVVFDAKAATFFFPLHRLSPNDADQGAGREQESFLVSRKGDALVVRQNFSDFFVSFCCCCRTGLYSKADSRLLL